jgi:dimethylaniline monooxygenase (N-oxide forming)
MTSADRRVAVIGAGPGGLVAARFLKAQGFQPIILESGLQVGGQWDRSNPSSGVWPDMRANTSRIMTRFSDLDYPNRAQAFPHNEQVRDYLRAYAEQFDLLPSMRFGTTVSRISLDPTGAYNVATSDGSGTMSRGFDRVVVATGRYHQAFCPPIDGIETFSGRCGVTHTSRYRGPEPFNGARVLVAGGNISALEVASDLARLGAARVVVAMRRQRYVVPKLIGGKPADIVGFTRFDALAAEAFPPEQVAASLKAFLLTAGADPSAFGTARPADNVLEAGITLSQDYVPLLAEGRIEPKPWIASIDGRTVRFDGGTAADFDAVIMGTGYSLSLPFLAPEISRTLGVDDRHIDLADSTFHPDLDGLAFVGLYPLIGPYFPVLELQARYLAYAWSGAIPAPTREQLAASVAAYRKRRGGRQSHLMHALALRFARLAGVEPQPAQVPKLARALLFGPLGAVSFRLQGPEVLPDAPTLIARDAACFGVVPGPSFTGDENRRLSALAAARPDMDLARLVDRGEARHHGAAR